MPKDLDWTDSIPLARLSKSLKRKEDTQRTKPLLKRKEKGPGVIKAKQATPPEAEPAEDDGEQNQKKKKRGKQTKRDGTRCDVTVTV